MTKVTKGLLATTLAAAIAAAWWMGRTPEQKVTAQPGKAASGAASAQAKGAVNVKAETRPGPPQVIQPSAASGAAVQATFGKSLEELVNSSATLANAYRALENTGSVDAKYFSAVVLSHCSNYHPKVAAGIEKRIRSDTAVEAQPARLAELTRRVDSCTGVAGMDPTKAIETAATSGSAKALAHQFAHREPTSRADNEAITQKVQALVQLRDPYVTYEAAAFFGTRDGPFVWEVPGVAGTLEGREMEAAFLLLSCDTGRDCGPNTPDAVSTCIQTGLLDNTRCNVLK